MFRSKKDVERHVLDVLSKIDNENEKNLRGYTFARLFFQVKDYDSAQKYLSGFLSVRDHHAPAHKLMAQIYEAKNSYENALQSYKRSLEIDSHQNAIVLKICELYCKLSVDHETAKYWADRAEQIFPHNDIVFKLRECLVYAEGDPDHQELENLIANELQSQPKNIDLRIKLLRLYLDTERVKEAYEHAVLIESKMLFPSSSDWYYMLIDIYEAYQEECKQDSEFYIHYLSALDHLVSLNLTEPWACENIKTPVKVNDAAHMLFLFDKYLKKASEQNNKEGSWSYFLHHMKGQLFFHMMNILLKRSTGMNMKEFTRFSAGLALVCYLIKPSNLLQEMWFSNLTENQKVFTNFFQQGSIRTSFVGHVIQSLCTSDKSKWLQMIKSEVCMTQIKERIFNCIFSSVSNKSLSDSYFMSNPTFESSSLEFPSENALKEYDKCAHQLCASSLHHILWLEMHQTNNILLNCPLSQVFKGLQYSNKNLSKGSCESLCILDLESYLYASVCDAKFDMEALKSIATNNSNHASYMSSPPNIAPAVCSPLLMEWWRAAYGLHSCVIKDKLGESRRVLQQGLEVIRGIGNHGLPIQIVVHLAKSFADKAEFLLKNIENSNSTKKKILPENIIAIQFRATHYWNLAIGMLEKAISGNATKAPREPIFYSNKYNQLSKSEMRELLETGKLYLAVQLMEADKLNEAAEILSKLSSAYGSFYLALTLKKFASQENKYSNSRKVFLTRALNSVHETMDRIKDDSGHPLNKEIHIILEDIELELGPGHSISNGNTEDIDETDAYDSISPSNSVYVTPTSFSLNMQSTPKPSSKFMSNKSNLNLQSSNSDYQKHFQPSPERLDAQIRALALNQDTVIKTIMEQNKSLLETNKSIVETLQRNNEVLTDLKRQLDELKISDSNALSKKAYPKKTNHLKGQGDDEFENLDPHSLLEYYEENGEDYRAAGSSYGYNPARMAPEAAFGYTMPPSLPPGPPPSLAHYNYQYPHAVLPSTPVAERPQFYPPPGQSLPFSEGQQLPQFHFHTASPVVKPPPILGNISNMPHTLPSQPPPSLQQPTALVHSSSSTLPISSPWSKPVGVPHAFQIPLPPSASFVSSSNLMSQSSTNPVVTTHSNLKSLLSTSTTSDNFTGSSQLNTSVTTSTPVIKSIFSGASKTPEHTLHERSRCDSEIAGSPEIDGHDIEREVMGDFKPLIPLPDEIIVETGEEDETVLFEDRAKLYRFVEQEWKERGLGTVKVLYDEGSQRVRLLMRRDQVLKVCANHYITPNMEVQPLKTSDRAWTWFAQDFADNELKPEYFCIRFKTSELALNFKTAFEKAVNIAKDSEKKTIVSPNKPSQSSPSPQKPFGFKFLHKAGSWACPVCYIVNSSDRQFCEACETKKPKSNDTTPVVSASAPSAFTTTSFAPLPASGTFTFNSPFTSSTETSNKQESSPKNVFGGFTFSSSSIVKEVIDPDVKEREILVVSTKSKNEPQVAKIDSSKVPPFSGFSFTSPPATTKPSLFSHINEKDAQTLIASTKADSTTPFKEFGFPTSILSSQSTISKESNLSNSNTTFDVSFKITAPTNFTSLTTQSSSQASNSAPSLSKMQSLVENVNPTFVLNPKDQNTSSISTTNSVKAGETQSFAPITSSLNTSSKGNSDLAPEDFVPTAEFKPVVPLPALVDLKTGEEDGDIIFCERAKLFRYDSNTKEWKERGIGELKILFLKNDNKYRILMRRDHVLKLCANHNILPTMILTPLASNQKSWVWCAQDFSEGELVQEKFCIKFKTVEIGKQFFTVFEQCINDLGKTEINDSQSDICKGNKDTFEKLLEPTSNSWQCSKCQKYSSNLSSCVYCKTPFDRTVSDSKATDNKKPLSELFKPPVDSWECTECYVRNNLSNSNCASCNSSKPGLFNNQELTSTSTKPISELFKPAAGSWSCEVCLVRNNSEQNKCLSCETPKPGSDVSATMSCNTASKFNFGSQSSANSSTSIFSFGSPGGGFVFGTKPTIQSSTFTFGQTTITKSDQEQSSTFAFGQTTPTKSDQVSGFKPTLPNTNTPVMFGGAIQKLSTSEQCNVSIPPVTAPPTFVFGSSENSKFSFASLANQNSEDEPVEFRFGSPQKYEFNFSGVRPRSPSKTPKSPRSPEAPSDVEEEDEVVASDADNIYFTPVIPLPPKVDVKTGEEHENTLFCQRAKLFRFNDGEWKERGLGDVKILRDEKTQRLRLLMRREQVLKVCLNHYLSSDVKFEWRGDKSLSWAATDFSENEAIPELFAIRFKTPELAQDFKNAIDDALSKKINQKSQDAPSNAAFKPPTNFSFQGKSLFGNISENKDIGAASEQKSQNSSDTLKNFSFKLETPPKVESSFGSGSLSFRFGASVEEKPVFGNFADDKSSSFSFKDKSVTGSFFDNTSFGISNAKPMFGGEGFKFGSGFSAEVTEVDESTEVEIVYEDLPSEEKITAAEKLKLPRTFYLYENKTPCSGCRGCTDTIPPHRGELTDVSEQVTIKEETPESKVEESMLFGTTRNTVSFTDLAAGKDIKPFVAESNGSKNVFAGAGTQLFANLNTSGGDGGDDTVPENPDIHFEPLIPLPDLIDVKTGEEDETPLFVHRAKLFRFDVQGKQWKERGLGDIKILKHKENVRYRVILRRDQVHKIACNHCITEDMSLAPLSTSENAVCWNAIDYSDGAAEASKFAVRFKDKDILEKFKKVFNDCIENVKQLPSISPIKTSEASANAESFSVKPVPVPTQPTVISFAKTSQNPQESSAANDSTDNEDQNSDEISDDEDNLLFEKRVTFEIIDDVLKTRNKGMGKIQMSYDDSVFGYHITIVNDDGEDVCDHVIAIQNCLRTEGKKAVWSAIDVSIQPARNRQFIAHFSSVDALKEFQKHFEEGKEFAVTSGIVEIENFTEQ